MRNIKSILSIIVLLILTSSVLFAQTKLTIGISKDANTNEFNEFSKQLKKEITNLINSDFDISFKELTANWDTIASKKNIYELMNDPKVDYVITVGYISSKQISQLNSFSKPVIAETILDGELQNMPLKSEDNTGINNFTYLESIIELKNNLQEFSRIFETKNIAVIIPHVFKENFPQLSEYFNENKTDFNIYLISVKDSSSEAFSQLPEEVEAVIVLPMLGFSPAEIQNLFTGLNTRHLPSLAVSGIKYLDLGATITMTAEFTFQKLARQIALRIMKISEGTNPSQLSVNIDIPKRVSIINMESIRLTNKFPKWNILNESILINVTNFSSGKNMNLQMAIAEALESNLQGKMAAKDVEIADKEVRIAQSNMLPQISIGGSAIALSENIVEAAMGQKGAFTLNGSASLKQVIFSESVFANIAINKLMAESKRFYSQQTILDVVSNTSVAYISLLFSKSNLLIQNENINATMKNLEMAKAKEAAGQTGLSDINRWVSELNMNKMKFNDAYTVYRNNMYQINQQLNSEINSTINIPDSNSIDKTILIDEDVLKQIFENPELIEKYAGFVIEEMTSNSPELQQLLAMTDIVERKNRLYKNQWFMPELVAFGWADQAFLREGTIQPEGMPVPPPPDDMTYNLGLSLKIPIFQGGKSAAQAKKTIIELNKLDFQKESLLNQLETGIRSNVQKLRTSYLELELSKNAANAANENFKMVQDAYFQGAVNIIQLIDAQNVMTRTKHMANIAYYQYVLDYLIIERYQGKFIFLNSEEEREDYAKRLQNYLLKD
ncbi:MAG: TolC family protein [Bacteroidales bacterium]|nr:TolC family protein [Bacteroidales bacterium]